LKTIRRSVAILLLLSICLSQAAFAAPAAPAFANELEAAFAFADRVMQGENSMHISVPADFDYTLCYRYLSMLYRDAYAFEYIPTPFNAYIHITYNDASQHADAQAETGRLARKLIHPDMTEREKYMAIHSYLLEHVEYDMHAALNQGIEASNAFSAYGALIDGLAVCDGISAAFAMICRAANLPCIYVASPEMNHSWNAVWYQGEIRYIDTTYELTGNTEDRYFMVTESQLARDHKWDREVVKQLTARLWDERYLSAYMLNSIGGLFRGSDKGYELNRQPTRAEAAIMLVRFLGMEQEALQNSSHMHMPFTDVNPNHAPYIAMLYALGLTNGTSATTFSPDIIVQPRDYMTFMLRALGYSDAAGEFAWETAVDDSLRLDVLDVSAYMRLTDSIFDRGRMASVSLTVLQAADKNGEVLYERLAQREILSMKKYEEFFKNN